MNELRDRILIVDDERLNIRMLDEMLRDKYDIIVATSGEQAITRAVMTQPDIILLDIQMPEIDGYEVCRRLTENDATRGIPVIFITIMSAVENEQRGLELGAVDYITKPFSPAIVKARLKNHLELKRQRDLLSRMSMIDGLTGVANRRQFEKTIDQEWRRALRMECELSLIMADIDSFKGYNDYFGHTAGDDCLKRIATALQAGLPRITDLVARYGGEEFAMILPMTGCDGAEKVAEKLRLTVRDLAIANPASGVCEVVTLSLGVATLAPAPEEHSPSRLIVTADRMLYRAKEMGRDRVCATSGALV